MALRKRLVSAHLVSRPSSSAACAPVVVALRQRGLGQRRLAQRLSAPLRYVIQTLCVTHVRAIAAGPSVYCNRTHYTLHNIPISSAALNSLSAQQN